MLARAVSARARLAQPERAECTLSLSTQATIETDLFFQVVDYFGSLSCARFEKLGVDYLPVSVGLVERCFYGNGFDMRNVHEVAKGGGSTGISKVQSLIRELLNCKEQSKYADLGEAVADGAAVQAATVAGQGSSQELDLLCLHVAPLSMVLETAGGVMTPLIERDALILTKRGRSFTTYADNQPGVVVQISVAARVTIADADLLGEIRFDGIPYAPRGVPLIRDTFDIDFAGILNVSAQDERVARSTQTVLANVTARLSQADIDCEVQEVEGFRSEDENNKQNTEGKTDRQNYGFTMWRTLNAGKLGDNFEATAKEKMEKAVQETFHWLDKSHLAERMSSWWAGR